MKTKNEANPGLQPGDKPNILYRTYSDTDEINIVRMKTLDKEKHTLEFVITTEEPAQDSYYGPPRVLSMKGVNLKRYRNNPAILSQHEHNPLTTIGRSLKVFIEDDKLIALAEFDVEDEFSARVYGKIERGFVRAASVGFRVTRERLIEEGQTDKTTGLEGPVLLATQWQLHEWSVVAVGADSQSLGRSEGEEPPAGSAEELAADGKVKFFLPPLKNPFNLTGKEKP